MEVVMRVVVEGVLQETRRERLGPALASKAPWLPLTAVRARVSLECLLARLWAPQRPLATTGLLSLFLLRDSLVQWRVSKAFTPRCVRQLPLRSWMGPLLGSPQPLA